MAPVLEGQHGIPKSTVILTPHDGSLLRGGVGDTGETGFCRIINRTTARVAPEAGHRYQGRLAPATQTAVDARHWPPATGACGRQEDLEGGNGRM